MTTAEKIAAMKANKNQTRLEGPTKMPNGKWRHPHDANEFDTHDECTADYRFCKEWGCK